MTDNVTFQSAVKIASDETTADITDFAYRRGVVMRSGLDWPCLDGIEVGPLASPIIHKSMSRVQYVDHADTDSLREKCRAIGGVDASKIVDVDAVWGDATLLQALHGQKQDYIVASHVVEHVPDLVTWLSEAADLLKADGQLRLVLPDKRFSFDALREETRLSDILTAWLQRNRRPQVRDVLDAKLNVAREVDGWGLYEGRAHLRDARPTHSFAQALEYAQATMDFPNIYTDVHCWVFRPKHFATLMASLSEFGLLRLACVNMSDAVWPMLEFYVFMSPCEDRELITKTWRDAADALPEDLPGSAADQRTRDERCKVEMDRAAYERAIAETKAMKASLSWRLTSPLRSLKSALLSALPIR